MNTTTTQTGSVTCPKCDGARYIRAFAHVVGGACFLCGATGTVDASTLSRQETGPSATDSGKTIETSLGAVYIYRDAVGFVADLDEGRAWFIIRGGRVVEVALSCGLERITTPRAFGAILTEAHRAAKASA